MTEELKTPAGLQTSPIAIKFGILGGLLCIVVSVVLYVADLQFESWANWINTLVLLSIILIGQRTIRQEHPGLEVGFGSLVGAGMLISVIITVLTVAYFFIYVYVIDPDFVNTTLEISRQKMIEAGLSEDKIEQALSISAKIMTPPVMAGIATLSTLMFGGIFSVIGAAIFKQEKQLKR